MNLGSQGAKRELRWGLCHCVNAGKSLPLLKDCISATNWRGRQKCSSFKKIASRVPTIPVFSAVIPPGGRKPEFKPLLLKIFSTREHALSQWGIWYPKMSRCSESQHWSCVIFSKIRIDHWDSKITCLALWASSLGNHWKEGKSRLCHLIHQTLSI